MDQVSTGDFFDAGRSADVVNARMGGDIDIRFREVMTIMVKHMHAAVKDARLTTDEWMSAIQFLTEVGHTCTDWRQEFILLSDTLGISMLVDAINHDRPEGATENSVLGPFYVSHSPHYKSGADISMDGKGEPMLVEGRLLDNRGKPVAGATIEVWQANEDGFYDVQQKGIQPKSNLRGTFTSGDDGSYWFRSAKPRFYPIPSDGPVGRMLAALGRHPNRAAHVHFIIKAQGYETVVTELFTPDCPYLREDAVFGVKQSLIADFQKIDNPSRAKKFGMPSPFWAVSADFILVAAQTDRKS